MERRPARGGASSFGASRHPPAPLGAAAREPSGRGGTVASGHG